MSALSTEAGLLNLLEGIRGTSTSTLLLKDDDVTEKGKDDRTAEEVQWVSEYDSLSSEIDDGDGVKRERERDGRRREGGTEEGSEEGSGGVNSRHHESSINYYDSAANSSSCSCSFSFSCPDTIHNNHQNISQKQSNSNNNNNNNNSSNDSNSIVISNDNKEVNQVNIAESDTQNKIESGDKRYPTIISAVRDRNNVLDDHGNDNIKCVSQHTTKTRDKEVVKEGENEVGEGSRYEERKAVKALYKQKQQSGQMSRKNNSNNKNGDRRSGLDANSDDFRVGGMLGRGKGLKAGFQIDQVRGLYDDDEEEEGEGDGGEGIRGKSLGKVRRKGVIYFVPRSNGMTGVVGSPLNQDSEQGGGGSGVVEGLHANGTTQSSALSRSLQREEEGSENGGVVGGEGGGGADVFGGEVPGLGFLSYIADSDDGVMRACALRTIVVSNFLSVCLSVCLSVGRSVGRSVLCSVRGENSIRTVLNTVLCYALLYSTLLYNTVYQSVHMERI